MGETVADPEDQLGEVKAADVPSFQIAVTCFAHRMKREFASAAFAHVSYRPLQSITKVQYNTIVE